MNYLILDTSILSFYKNAFTQKLHSQFFEKLKKKQFDSPLQQKH